MAESSNDGSVRNELNTWQEIADYLRVSVRAAQLYESKHGMPVRRLTGGKARVWAYRAEIDDWKRAWEARGHEISERDSESGNSTAGKDESTGRPGRLTPMRVALAVAGAIALAGLAYYFRPRPPFQFTVEERSIVAHDSENRQLWRQGLPEPLLLSSYSTGTRWMERGDLDSRPATLEFIFRYVPQRYLDGAPMELWAFSQGGQVLWRFKPGKAVKAVGEFSDHYRVNGFAVISPAGAVKNPLVTVSANHSHFFPNQISILDGSSGTLLRDYWHPGYLGHLKLSDLDGDATPEILVGGVNDGLGQAALVILDPLRLEGAARQEGNPAYQIAGMAPPKEKAIVLFPRTCTAKAGEPHNRVSGFIVSPGGLEVYVSETHRDDGPSLTYTLDRNLVPVSVTASPAFISYHNRLAQSRVLNHTYNPEESRELLAGIVVKRNP